MTYVSGLLLHRLAVVIRSNGGSSDWRLAETPSAAMKNQMVRLPWRDVTLRSNARPEGFTGSRCVEDRFGAHRLSEAIAANRMRARGESRRNRLRQPPDHQQNLGTGRPSRGAAPRFMQMNWNGTVR